jgi:hypothetical protein
MQRILAKPGKGVLEKRDTNEAGKRGKGRKALGGTRREAGGGEAGEFAEIVDQVRLVVVAAI